ncbi:hypothetical protein ACHAW5_009291 [Stephanodiscus triporus]|uniref:RRM domain-containing protein n=1 Tax=Stephanodiscus triporus TaxID=2934178 RepID=A0ABD3PXC9_9STRA
MTEAVPAADPSFSPSSARPTSSSYPSSTSSASSSPTSSFSPSMFDLQDVSSQYLQYFEILPNSSALDDMQMISFAALYESYTEHFGYEEGGIDTTCTIVRQEVGQSALTAKLTIRFNMFYSTRLGKYNITDYNRLFEDFISNNLEMVKEDLNAVGITQVVKVTSMKMLTKMLSSSPSSGPTRPPGMSHIVDAEVNQSSILGFVVGFVVFFFVVAVVIVYSRYQKKLKKDMDRLLNQNMATARATAATSREGGGGGIESDLGDDSVDAASAFESPVKAEFSTATNEDCHSDDDDVRHGLDDDRPIDDEESDPRWRNEVLALSVRDTLDLIRPQLPQHFLSSQIRDARESHNNGPGNEDEDEDYRPPPAGLPNLSTLCSVSQQQQQQQQRQQHIDNDNGNGPSQVHSSSSPDRPLGCERSNITTEPIDTNNQSYATLVSDPFREEQDTSMPMFLRHNSQQRSEVSLGEGGDHEHMLINDASFSSSTADDEGNHVDNEYDYYENSPDLLDGLTDEFDNYKNQDLEKLRNAVERSIDGVDGMMSLAMAHAYTSDPSKDKLLEWFGGEQDDGRIEASCLCDTYDWLKINEMSSLDSVNEYFREILNRIVITVMLRIIPPLQGANIVHSCATILGLDLLKKPPEKTLVITGMRKTNTLEQGYNFIVKAFKPFGDIEDAAIAPQNHGFGIIRFTRPESVELALEEYKQSEIEIQDVSVSVKTLKSERTYS